MKCIVRTDLPPRVHQQLKHLAVDLRRPMGVLLIDAVVLLLRYHDRGDGLPPPEAPPAAKGGAR
jgi:hypothetical protein